MHEAVHSNIFEYITKSKMSETESKSTSTTEGKRSLDIPASAEEVDGDASIITPTNGNANSAKKQKTLQDSSNEFRAWSSQIHDSSDTCTIYTLKCTFGDASKPLNSYIKGSKVPFIKNELEMRGLSTVGTKPVLLERLQKELPSVTLEIDSRECMQRIVNSMLCCFKWDNTHLFECEMPRRGELECGVGKLWATLPSFDIGLAIKMGSISSDPRQNDQHLRKRLDQLGITCEMIARIQNDPDTLGDIRKLTGSAFDPMSKGMGGSDFDDDYASDGSQISLEQLALRKGDQMKMIYDFGDHNTFVVEVQEVKKNVPVLPEITHYGHKTRVKMVGKGQSKMRKQYYDGSDEIYM
jgi:hypothetical protein